MKIRSELEIGSRHDLIMEILSDNTIPKTDQQKIVLTACLETLHWVLCLESGPRLFETWIKESVDWLKKIGRWNGQDLPGMNVVNKVDFRIVEKGKDNGRA